jgi:hypothetical protein
MRIYSVLILLVFCSCQKKVKINQNSKNPNLPVFSGWINTLEGEQIIQIQSTSNYSSYSIPSSIYNGNVYVTNNNNIEFFTPSNLGFISSSNYSLQKGSCAITIKVNNKTYVQDVEVFDPISMTSISAYEDVSEPGVSTGILVEFDLPQEDNYTIVFELLADSTGGTDFVSLTPSIKKMVLFNNFIDEYNLYGDILLFNNELMSDDGTINYKLVAHRISTLQYNYLLRIQEEPSSSIYSTQPVNLPSMFSNGGLGIVIVSSDSFIEFNL